MILTSYENNLFSHCILRECKQLNISDTISPNRKIKQLEEEIQTLRWKIIERNELEARLRRAQKMETQRMTPLSGLDG